MAIDHNRLTFQLTLKATGEAVVLGVTLASAQVLVWG